MKTFILLKTEYFAHFVSIELVISIIGLKTRTQPAAFGARGSFCPFND